MNFACTNDIVICTSFVFLSFSLSLQYCDNFLAKPEIFFGKLIELFSGHQPPPPPPHYRGMGHPNLAGDLAYYPSGKSGTSKSFSDTGFGMQRPQLPYQQAYGYVSFK